MFVLDTNHLRELVFDSVLGRRLTKRIVESQAEVVLPIVAADESFRGWMAVLAAARTDEQEVIAYSRLDRSIEAISKFFRLPWDLDAAARFRDLRRKGVRIGTKDLKIACISLEYGATLLKRNTVDFSNVPGLSIENWLD
jgi:tRNA(fMet)-specific endonuclease VapC